MAKRTNAEVNAEIVAEGKADRNKGTIISLCDFTGNMVKPWADAGFDCLCLDTRHSMVKDKTKGNITFRFGDVRTLTPTDLPKPLIIFAFPPCTHLAVSGARWFKSKGLQGLIDALTLVESCRKLCEWYGCPWMIENPVGRLSTQWRKPDNIFQPWEYGDLYSKKTCIWHGGGFVFPPPMNTEEPFGVQPLIHRMPPSDDRGDKRSITPPGFADAVYFHNYPPIKESCLRP